MGKISRGHSCETPCIHSNFRACNEIDEVTRDIRSIDGWDRARLIKTREENSERLTVKDVRNFEQELGKTEKELMIDPARENEAYHMEEIPNWGRCIVQLTGCVRADYDFAMVGVRDV